MLKNAKLTLNFVKEKRPHLTLEVGWERNGILDLRGDDALQHGKEKYGVLISNGREGKLFWYTSE